MTSEQGHRLSCGYYPSDVILFQFSGENSRFVTSYDVSYVAIAIVES